MLRHRIEGLIGLHSALLALIVASLFLVTLGLLPYVGIELVEGANVELYFCGVLVAMAWSHRQVRGVAAAYGRLTVWEALRLSARQMVQLMLTLFTLSFLTKDVGISRVFLLTFLGVSAGAVFATNLYLQRIFSHFFFRHSAFRTVIIASPDEVSRIEQWIQKYEDVGVNVVGYAAEAPSRHATHFPWLGRPDVLPAILEASMVDQVLIDQQGFPASETLAMRMRCEQLGCRVRCFVDISTLLPFAGASLEQDGRYAFASFTPEPLDNPMNRVAKRTLDIVIALPVVMFILPVLFVVTAAVQRFQSRGPVLYRQRRTGINRREFMIFKIRTMHVNSESREAIQASRVDSRIYPFGRILRRFSLDEIPQFINVLLGDMSVVGPRPHLLEHDEAFAQVVKSYRRRHFVKPGITGLAQSKGYRGEVVEPSMIVGRVRYDMDYIVKWSLLMDLKIFFRTVLHMVKPPPSAY